MTKQTSRPFLRVCLTKFPNNSSTVSSVITSSSSTTDGYPLNLSNAVISVVTLLASFPVRGRRESDLVEMIGGGGTRVTALKAYIFPGVMVYWLW